MTHITMTTKTGNICRSPIAEALFRHKVEEKGLSSKVSYVNF